MAGIQDTVQTDTAATDTAQGVSNQIETGNTAIDEFLNQVIFQIHGFDFKFWNLFWIVITLAITWAVVRVIRLALTRKVIARDMDKGSIAALIQLIKYFAYTIAIVVLLESIGVKMNALLAGSAALLVGIGLGLQQVFYDVVSGIILLFEGTIKVGDVVEVRHEIVGRVQYIGLRTSKIETRENTYVIVPNSKFISGDVVNWSHVTTSTRFKIVVGVAYGSDVRLVEKCLLHAAQKHAEIEASPKPFVRFSDFGDSALIFELFFWTTETFTVENLKSDLRFKVDAIFRENNIIIPFPQRDLHIKSSSLKGGALGD